MIPLCHACFGMTRLANRILLMLFSFPELFSSATASLTEVSARLAVLHCFEQHQVQGHARWRKRQNMTDLQEQVCLAARGSVPGSRVRSGCSPVTGRLFSHAGDAAGAIRAAPDGPSAQSTPSGQLVSLVPSAAHRTHSAPSQQVCSDALTATATTATMAAQVAHMPVEQMDCELGAARGSKEQLTP